MQAITSGKMSWKKVIAKWQFILIVVLTLASVTFMVSTLIPPTYKSEVQLLILQKNLAVDAYRAAKSNEYAGQILEQVVASTNFMEGVIESRHTITDDFGIGPKERIDTWNDRVRAESISNTGILKITVLHPNPSEGKNIMEAIIEKLSFDGKRYHGNDNIMLKKISGPVYFNEPAFPKVWLNTGAAAIAGLFLAISMIYLLGDKADKWMYKKEKPEIQPDERPVPVINTDLYEDNYVMQESFDLDERWGKLNSN